MGSKRETNSSSKLKVYCITWNDERWSADKETLDAINKMISVNQIKYSYGKRIVEKSLDVLGYIYGPFLSIWVWCKSLAKKR